MALHIVGLVDAVLSVSPILLLIRIPVHSIVNTHVLVVCAVSRLLLRLPRSSSTLAVPSVLCIFTLFSVLSLVSVFLLLLFQLLVMPLILLLHLSSMLLFFLFLLVGDFVVRGLLVFPNLAVCLSDFTFHEQTTSHPVNPTLGNHQTRANQYCISIFSIEPTV